MILRILPLLLLLLTPVMGQTASAYKGEGFLYHDTNNSTTTPLAASATFTGTATEVWHYKQTHIVLKFSPNEVPDGDPSTAKGSFFFDYSPDGVNWDIQVPMFVRSGIFIPQTLITVDRYFRVRYVNDGGTSAIANLGLSEAAGTPTEQTAFRLNVYHTSAGTKELGRTIDQSVSGTDPASLTRGVIMGKDVDGTYQNVPLSDNAEFVLADYGVDVSRGNRSRREGVRIFGRNGSVGTSEEDIWDVGGSYNFLTSAASIRVASGGNAADNNSGGAGARTVLVTGLDGSGNTQTATLTLAGASASGNTATTFLRVNKAVVVTAGTYGAANTGDVTIETTGGTTIAQIPAGVGETRLAVYSVPNNKKGYVRRIRVMPEGNKDGTFSLYKRENFDDTSVPVSPKIKILALDEVTAGSSDGFTLVYPIELPEKTDVWVSAEVATGSGAMSAAFEIEVIDD